MKNRKLFTTNSKNYTDKHNEIMDLLLWGFSESKYGQNNIRWIDDNLYESISAEGDLILEYLWDCDLICELREDEDND